MEDQNAILIGAASRQHMFNAISSHYPSMSRPTPIDDEDPWSRITRLRRARTRSAHASCWSLSDESEPLWWRYCRDNDCPGVGVVLRTTLGRLKGSVKVHKLDVRPITYLRYQEAPAFTDDIAPLFHKRHGFNAECELRLLKFNEEHFKALIPNFKHSTAAGGSQPDQHQTAKPDRSTGTDCQIESRLIHLEILSRIRSLAGLHHRYSRI